MAAAASEFDNVEFGPPCHNTCQLTGTDASCDDTEMLLQSTKNRINHGTIVYGASHGDGAHEGDRWEGWWRADQKHGWGHYHYRSGDVDVSKFESGVEVAGLAGEGVRWSGDRRKAWVLRDGRPREELSIEAASEHVRQLMSRAHEQTR